jgi:hypothetical protein
MVHGANKTRASTPLSTAAIVAVLAVLPAGASMVAGSVLAILVVLAILALILGAKIPSASPGLAVALTLRILRLVQSFIHSYTCEL